VELDLAAARHMFGLEHVIFRPHNVYGEYQNLGDPYRNVIGIFMNQVMSGKPMTIFGDGTQCRAFSYVGDIAPAIADCPWVAGARNEVFNIGADLSYSLNHLATYVATALGKPDHPVTRLPARNEVKIAYSDHSKAARVFGSTAQTGLADGILRMAAWALKAGVRSGKPFEAIELTRNLPPSWVALLGRTLY
jgi:UDP-glucose 4-epimerase